MATTPRGPRQGTGFINWGSFVGANRGGTDRTARALMAPTENDLTTGLQQHDVGLELLNRDIGANTIDAYNPNTVTDDEIDRYSEATYGGPSAATDNEQYAAGLGMAQRAGTESQRLADMYSRMGSLKDAFGKDNPGYSRGMQAFDSALLDSTNRTGFKDLSKRSSGLLDKFSASSKAVGERANEARRATAERAGQYKYAKSQRSTLGEPQGNPIQTPGTMPGPTDLGSIYTNNADQIADENKKKAKYGFRG